MKSEDKKIDPQSRIMIFWFCFSKPANFSGCIRVFLFPSFLMITLTFQLGRFHPQRSSGQSRGRRCNPFPSPVRVFVLIAHRVQHSHYFSLIFIECLPTHALAHSADHFFKKEKVLTSASMHSVRLEPTKLILVGTRTTYRATEVAGKRNGK